MFVKQNKSSCIYILQASKNIANFYACYDLMEITTKSNLVALATELSGLSFDGHDAHISEDTFIATVKDIFDKVTILGKWERGCC